MLKGYDQQSMASTRKSSRLSNFNPMKNRNFKSTPDLSLGMAGGGNPLNSINAGNSPYYNNSSGDNVSMTTVTNASSTNASSNMNQSGYGLTPVSTNTTTNTSVESMQNYHLTKMETNDSIDSNFSVQPQFRIELNLNKREIELIRFTWNKMLLDEPIVESNSPFPFPGGFNVGNNVNSTNSFTLNSHQNGTKPANTRQVNNIASSLFCRQLYSNLLSMDPKLERLFPSIKHQAVAFAGVMSLTISQLENLSTMNDYLEKLGKRHSRILGIEPAMFEMMGEALIQTFHERFGNKFSHDLEILWIKLYLFLANSLLQFGIDPVLKLNPGSSNEHQQVHAPQNGVFRVNDINRPQFGLSSSASISNLNAPSGAPPSTAPSLKDGDVGEERRSPEKKKKSSIRKKKKDCVIQ